ncbi:hypothetical protein ACFPN1_13470 [Lysobacter yangpyeongensis]|uniref:Flavin reductase n=1 Tax=Lysobacter yangpyeongensis TaxID=346182 RepID=A0ABW0SR33_9GAMM
MNTQSLHPQPHWSSQDLADAVPRRLSELFAPVLMTFDGADAANGIALSPWAFDWRRREVFTDFRVR